MKSEKEIIDDIISRIKEQPDRGYREGAWENFKRQNPGTTTKTRPMARWISAAAALLLIGMGTLYYVKNSTILTSSDMNVNAVIEHKPVPTEASAPGQSHTESTTAMPQESPSNPSLDNVYAINNNTILANRNNYAQSQAVKQSLGLPLMAEGLNAMGKQIEIPSGSTLRETLVMPGYASIDLKKPQSTTSIPENLILAAKSIPTSELNLKEVETRNQNKQVRFGDKFDLALFVSPQSTGQKTNVGGGLTLAYNLTNKISVRTGASYNSYEVGIMKNPIEPSSSETVVVNQNQSNAPTIGKMTNAYSAAENNRMILPNINAVTSVVQSVDIPLEVKYNVGKSLYAVAGVSYSAILGQERNAHYVDNVNVETFSQGFPENETQMKSAVKAVSKTVKSAEENVSTNGFNGFVNFSIGKKVKVNNRFGVSVEPYFKIPVGQYRRADMDYTNGGIRVMTNF
ncbi:outer membrane beta-barrel protein [Sphingobacterium tabacisoli]|uniref:Outer membrane beta-barrel protein n=1 Tax=Sphingobacterium tabacisoli TaxID=2044855 RepID=A0ABW5L122_9SPHI|nr:outer membrane beta-barrel protein [Sphingobacterium tabacisoli]